MRRGAGSRALDFGHELVVDLFAGGGGASLGITRGYRSPDVAVNHNAIAIGVHTANHPETKHYIKDVFEVDPLVATGGQPVGVLWASPDCRHHSKAKGGKPRSQKIRGLAWVVVKWAAAVKPRIIFLENVEEFADWGPLLPNGQPCPLRKGLTYRRWKRELEKLGGVVESREIRACVYGAPTIRKRLYVIIRFDGRAIVWPKFSHPKESWRSAAECIDFGLPANSIFGRKKPLAVNTQRRVAKGLWRFVLNAAKPFIVPLRGTSPSHTSTHSVDDPLSTVSGGGTHHALVAPALVSTSHGSSTGRSLHAWDVAEPLRTVDASGGGFALAALHLTECANGSSQRNFSIEEPMRTQCAQVKGGHFALTAAHLSRQFGKSVGSDLGDPAPTVTAGGGGKTLLVAAHIAKFRFDSAGSSMLDPLPTITSGGEMKRPAGAAHALGMVSAFMEQANTGVVGHDCRSPVSTITSSGANQRLVTAYMVKFYSNGGQWQGLGEPMHTVPTKDRLGLVQIVQVPSNIIAPEMLERAKMVADLLHTYLPEHFPEPADMVLLGDYVLVDVTLRMLTPRELARAQGFPDSYILDRLADGTPVTKTDQVRLIGNSVCPDVAAALVGANLAELAALYARTA